MQNPDETIEGSVVTDTPLFVNLVSLQKKSPFAIIAVPLQ
ncbi:hypothetical protein HMPREF1869_00341 [Bacteroidales bacterium KA00251]|nr:hypothetical protein HMPREF1869_00341 [Bacteroidales bacterium KA00251]